MCELSGFADSASAAADSAKKRYVWGVKVELICLVLAALFKFCHLIIFHGYLKKV